MARGRPRVAAASTKTMGTARTTRPSMRGEWHEEDAPDDHSESSSKIF